MRLLVLVSVLLAASACAPPVGPAVPVAPHRPSGCDPEVVRVELQRFVHPDAFAAVLRGAPDAVASAASLRGRWRRDDAWSVILDVRPERAVEVAAWSRGNEALVRYAGVEPSPCPWEAWEDGGAYGGAFPLDGVVAFSDGEWVVESEQATLVPLDLPPELRDVGRALRAVVEPAGPRSTLIAPRPTVRLVSLGVPARDASGPDPAGGFVSVTLRDGVPWSRFEGYLGPLGLETIRASGYERWSGTVAVPIGQEALWAIRFERDAWPLVDAAREPIRARFDARR